jgi:hypothetical protein
MPSCWPTPGCAPSTGPRLGARGERPGGVRAGLRAPAARGGRAPHRRAGSAGRVQHQHGASRHPGRCRHRGGGCCWTATCWPPSTATRWSGTSRRPLVQGDAVTFLSADAGG